MATIENCECIDELDLSSRQASSLKADYFFDNREIICELKAIETDSFYKTEEVLLPHTAGQEWPLIFGSVSLKRVLSHLPDGGEINREIVDRISDSIERAIKKANRQIRKTKETFALPDSAGMLIFLNDSVHALPPDITSYRIGKCLAKLTADSKPRYPNVSAVLVIHTAHSIRIRPNAVVLPIFAIKNQLSKDFRVEQKINLLMQRWVEFDGIPGVREDWRDMKFKFTRTKLSKP